MGNHRVLVVAALLVLLAAPARASEWVAPSWDRRSLGQIALPSPVVTSQERRRRIANGTAQRDTVPASIRLYERYMEGGKCRR